MLPKTSFKKIANEVLMKRGGRATEGAQGKIVGLVKRNWFYGRSRSYCFWFSIGNIATQTAISSAAILTASFW